MDLDEQQMLYPTNLTSIPSEATADLLSIISELERDEYSTNISSTEANTILDLENTEERQQMSVKPYLTIVEEPASNLYRFRYRSEGETAGSIPGEKQKTGRKSFPKIMVCNYDGLAALEVCCLTEDLRVHPNKLVWRKGGRSSQAEINAGVYRVEIPGGSVKEIKLGVNLSKKSDVLNLLSSKQELGVDPFSKGYVHAGEKSLKKLDLSRIRLCFCVSIKENDGTWVGLPPVYTQVISHNMIRSELKIRDISDITSSSAGGEKKILICDKLDPTGLQLVFNDELTGWTAFGEFSQADVHNRVCVVFTTPPYPQLREVTTVKMEMNKADGSASSSPIHFTYYPYREGVTNAKHNVPRTEPTMQHQDILEHNIGQASYLQRTLTPSSGSRSTYTYQDSLHPPQI